jgi:hypothetical protein
MAKTAINPLQLRIDSIWLLTNKKNCVHRSLCDIAFSRNAEMQKYVGQQFIHFPKE